MENSITWTNEKRKLSQLIPWQRNPRQIKGAEVTRLQESLVEFGQVEPTAIGPDNELYNGHQRLKSWAAKFGDIEIDVRVSSRALSEKEREKLTVYLHKGAAGSWDFDTLSSWEAPELIEWGFSSQALKEMKSEITSIDSLLKSESGEDQNYSRKIEAPIYTPKGDKPPISDLFDTTKALALIQEIDAAELPDEERQFLKAAALRHTVFNYRNIANYYAHSSAAVQRLMENSALVIIDFNRAIELGYVKLTEEIAHQYLEDYGDAG